MRTLTRDPSDPQQFDLYDAEQEVSEGYYGRATIHYRDAAEAKAFIAHVKDSALWRRLGGPSKIAVKVIRHDSSSAWAKSWENKIALPGWGFEQHTVLHEMAHLVTNDGHGPKFATTALMLYREFIGEDFAHAVADAYYKRGVIHDRPKAGL